MADCLWAQKIWVWGTCAFCVGCGSFDPQKGQSAPSRPRTVQQAVGGGGWRTPIPNIDTGDFTKPLGYANTPIVGLSIGALVTNPVITIRPDGNSCVSCHGGSATMRPQWDARTLTRTQFCNMVPSFLAANKPAVVKAVFGVWQAAGCPN